jgi:hypothetical protein
MKTALCRATAISIFLPMLVLSLAVGQASRCYAQMQAQPDAHTNVAALREPSPGESDTGAANGTAPTPARFSDWDWTWLNGNPRTKTRAFDSKFFTPEIRADLPTPTTSTNRSTTRWADRANCSVERNPVGAARHRRRLPLRQRSRPLHDSVWHVFSTATIRNDPSYAKGQWNLADADRYLAEAYGGYHING